ncbi:MAG: beta-lactamase family protein [Sphaerochaetaceae bacterium]|jgi:CubicO group peptidase (beta-lactamase class C family)|nr:beta-lactamase family protein [Sphaerochaetaceae bacterium]
MKAMYRLCVIGMVLIVLVSCSSTRPIQEQPFENTKEIAQEIGNSLVTGPGDVSAVSIAIMHEGRIIYSEGFGKRDIALNLPVETDTRFNIGSISKIFTATSILMLQEDGLLNLDDKVVDLFPAFSMADQRYAAITVRMLLDHTSGMPGTNMRDGFSTRLSSEYLQQSLEEFSLSMLKHDPGAFSPYCNDGFTVAQALVEHLSGISFTRFLQERIFEPLGMVDSSVGFYPQDENMAYGYAERETMLPKEYVNIIASGGITSTAEDLCRYSNMIFDENLLSESSINEFLAEQTPMYVEDSNFSKLLTFGLGWDFTSWEPYQSQGIQVLGKTGGTLEYTSMILVLPQSKSTVAVLCAGHMDPLETTLPIVDALLAESGQLPLKNKSDTPQIEDTCPLLPDSERFSGFYGSLEGLFRISFDNEDAAMQFEIYDGSNFVQDKSARHIGNGIFEKTAQESWYVFETHFGVPMLMELRPYNQAEISLTPLDHQRPAIAHEFTAGNWLPTNMLPYEMYMPLYSTAFIEELPCHIYIDNTVYAITDSRQTSMVLPTVRDQSPPRLDEAGHLVVGPYVCVNLVDIPALVSGQSIVADSTATSIWRKVTEQGTFVCTVPEGGRIIVLGPDLSELEDTLFSGKEQIEMDIFGSYVAFIGEDDTVFEPNITL